jgi:antitoxin ParD1/3/4
MPSSYTLGSHYEHLIRSLVDSGRYASASEVVRDALRLVEEREEVRRVKLEALRSALDAGLAGPFEPLDEDEILSAARTRARVRPNMS